MNDDLHPEIRIYWEEQGFAIIHMTANYQWYAVNNINNKRDYVANTVLDLYRLDLEIGDKRSKWYKLEDALQLIKMKAFW